MTKQYTCPMHPAIIQNKPGRCPDCGMRLVPVDQAKTMSMDHPQSEKITWKSYSPLFTILGLILLTAVTLSIRDFQLQQFSITSLMSYFMIGFFLVFASFKLIDLKGFAEGYSTYDLLAKKWFGYGYIYPFIELGFGLGMILLGDIFWLLIAEIIIMIFSGVGVAIKLYKKERFQCACLGTFLKVPLTKITLVENFGMALLAGLMIIMK